MNGRSACPFTGRKKRLWHKATQHRQKQVKGDRYTNCPVCRGIGGNHACTKCKGSGTVALQRKMKVQGEPRVKTMRVQTTYNRRHWQN